MRALFRILVLIPLGFMAACAAAGLMLLLAAGVGPGSSETWIDFAMKTAAMSLVFGAGIGAFVGLPALVVIILAEAFGWRSLVLHLCIGTVIGFTAFAALLNGDPSGSDLPVGAAAGAVGGFVYWLVAGRHSGLTRSQPRTLVENGGPAQSPPA